MHLSNQWQRMTPEERAANDPFRGFFGGIAALLYGFCMLVTWAMLIAMAIYAAVIVWAVVSVALQSIFGGGFS